MHGTMASYTTWNEWDEFEDDYCWCIEFLLDQLVYGLTNAELERWLFD